LYPDIELSIEVRRGAKQTTGDYGMIFITNLSPKPIELREVGSTGDRMPLALRREWNV
jgi:hypothetical protein